MKLDNYTISKIQDQVANYLFIKWLSSNKDDWQDEDIRDLWDKYHAIFAEQMEVIHD